MKQLETQVEKIEKWRKEKGLSREEVGNMKLQEVYKLVGEWEKSREVVTLETLDSFLPTKYIIPNNKLANKMTEVPYDEPFLLEVNSEKKVKNPVSINYDDENIKIFDKNKRFTPYDRTVHNAVCSIYEAGSDHFTPDRVYRVMNGIDDSQYVSPQARGAITRSLDKMRRTYAKVDYSNEAQAYRQDIEHATFEDHILSAKKVTLSAGGKEVIGYKLNGGKPLLYEYAQFTKQVLTVPIELLNTKDVIKSTPEVIVIREYLIRRIEVMKENQSTSNKILFEKIFNEIDHPEPTADKARKVRNNVEKLLTKFKKEGYIKDFKFYKSGRSFKGIDIIH